MSGFQWQRPHWKEWWGYSSVCLTYELSAGNSSDRLRAGGLTLAEAFLENWKDELTKSITMASVSLQVPHVNWRSQMGTGDRWTTGFGAESPPTSALLSYTKPCKPGFFSLLFCIELNTSTSVLNVSCILWCFHSTRLPLVEHSELLVYSLSVAFSGKISIFKYSKLIFPCLGTVFHWLSF